MKTLSLRQAAKLLKLHPETLRARAASGEIRAAKPGRSWVFLQDDLLDYLRSLAHTNNGERRNPSMNFGGKLCSTNDVKFGISGSRPPMVKGYAEALELKIAS